jgi:protein TonB
MSNRKNPQADLEKKRPVFFQAGFIVALCVVLVAIEWTSVSWMPTTIAAPITEDITLETEILPNTIKTKKKRPKPDKITPVIAPEPSPEPDPDPSIDPDPLPDPDLTEIEFIFGGDEGMEDDEPMTPFIAVEIMPYFAGCENITDRDAQKRCTDQQILKELARTKYPALVRDIGLEGTVYASFVVGASGNVQDIEIKRGVHPLLDSAVVRQIRTLPEFVPGRQQGKNVPVIMQVPVNFELR